MATMSSVVRGLAEPEDNNSSHGWSSHRLQLIRDACKLPPNERSKEQVHEIVEFIKDGSMKETKFFLKVTQLQQQALCRTMTIEEFKTNDFVCQKDDIADKYYTVLSGSVDVLQAPAFGGPCPKGTHPDGQCDCNKKMEKLSTLRMGHSFGEAAMQSEELPKRTASIRAAEPTELLVTRRGDYDACAGQLHRQFIEQRVKFLRQFPRIEEALKCSMVTTQDISSMANCLTERSLSGNEIAVRQGEVVDHMIFVRKGQLAMLRIIEGDGSAAVSQTSSIVTGTLSERKRLVKDEPHEAAPRVPNPPAPGSPKAFEQQLSTTFAKAIIDQRQRRKQALDDIMSSGRRKGSKGEAGGLGKTPKVKSSTSARPSLDGGLDMKKKKSVLSGKRPDSDQVEKNQKTEGSGGDEEQPKTSEKGVSKWNAVRKSFRTAQVVSATASMIPVPPEEKPRDGVEAAERSVVHFGDVASMRRKLTEFKYKEMTQQRVLKSREKGLGSSKGMEQGEGHEDVDLGTDTVVSRPKRVLRIGSLAAYQYFGDRQVCSSEVYPVSLVSDPVCEIYLLSKHDILRKLQRTVFPILFTPDNETLPSDQLLLDMHRQTERWAAFRRSMHGKAMDQRQGQVSTVPRALRDSGGAQKSRVDVTANLLFLGVHPEVAAKGVAVPGQEIGATTLRPKDEEFFSQASARFLRKFEEMKTDPGLRKALARAGLRAKSGLDKGGSDEDERDPNRFHFEHAWSKLRRFPEGLDLEEDVLEEQRSMSTASPQFGSTSPATPGKRGTVQSSGSRAQTAGSSDGFNDPVGSAASTSAPGTGSRAPSIGDAAPMGSARRRSKDNYEPLLPTVKDSAPLGGGGPVKPSSARGRTASTASGRASLSSAGPTPDSSHGRGTRRTVAFG